MARPIKETPVLEGKDARNFMDRMNTVSDRKVSSDDAKRMRENYEKLKAISKF